MPRGAEDWISDLPENNNGYTFIGPSRAAFDALIGRLPQAYLRDLPPIAKAWVVVATFNDRREEFVDFDDSLKQPFAKVARVILDEADATASELSAISTLAVRKGLLENDGSLKLAKNDEMRSLLEDVELYRKSKDYLPPEEWVELWDLAYDICDAPPVSRIGKRAAALGYVLANLAGAQPPV
ncbi:MAG TPA: hypothetical protein VFO38_01535 [Candidatus Saccharimonadales bacterium]|nr:hypothetical protein [Candidatus Saccharimonadales bacterium]